MMENQSRKKINKRTIFEILLILVILALAAMYFLKFTGINGGVKVYYYTPDGTTEDGPYAAGSLVTIKDGPEIDGYTFIGWRDEQGNIEKRSEVYVNEDTYFSAVYSVGLDTDDHMVYLSNDNGLFRPADPITRKEAVMMFYKLINTGTVGKGRFTDVSETDECYSACASLKDLGVIHGKYFHPDDYMSRAEFAQMLSCFCPGYAEYMDDTESEEEILRSEVTVIMSKVLNRPGDSKNNTSMVGTFLDGSPKSDYFWAVADATIEHEHKFDGGKEVWTSAKALKEYEPGYFFVNGALHYIDENGSPLLDGEVDGLKFNSRGEETSGDEELDRYVQKIIADVCDSEDMAQSDMLKAVFKFVSDPDNYNYLTRNIYEMGDDSWVASEAKTMIKTKKGNCYNFAAVFCELARGVGYDAKAVSGTMGIDLRPHAWVEIEKNGEMMLYDPEYQYVHPELNCYQRDSSYKEKYHYHTAGENKDNMG